MRIVDGAVVVPRLPRLSTPHRSSLGHPHPTRFSLSHRDLWDWENAFSYTIKTVRYDTLKVAKRIEAELGDEQPCFIEGSPGDWDLLPHPDGAFKGGIDRGYVRNGFAKKHNFEVIVGKSPLSCGEEKDAQGPSSKRFGFVQTLDTKPKRRLYEVLHSQGLQMNQAMAFLSDGDDTLRALQLEMSPKATHILDWFHLTMKLTVLEQRSSVAER